MTNLLLYNYYFRYKAYRKRIKEILEIDNDVNMAKILLDQIVIEHDKLNDIQEESAHLHHAKDHLDSFIINDSSILTQKDATIGALEEE